MTTFRVWAPKPQNVEIELNGRRRLPMNAADDGWWQIDVDEAGIRTDYAYIVDGSQPLPDPRSPWQPHGVHGASRVVDHEAFRWDDDGWQSGPLASAIIYELHVGTFTPEGTFDAAIEKLDHLVELGVTHVELMPVAAFPGSRGWGYDGVALSAPHHPYGGPDGLKALVNSCHRRGLAVILDVVYNHLGPDGNYLAMFGPYFTEHHKTSWGDAVNLDGAGSDEVRRFFIDNARMWLRDYHIDALRIDAVHALIDDSAVHFLEQLGAEVKALQGALGRHLALIAESDLNDPRVVRSLEMGGYGMDAQWSDDFHHALHVALTGEQEGYYADFNGLADLAAALQRAFVYNGRYSPFRQRRHGRPATGLPGYKFLGYIQNHDQIGNRAQGDRISHLVSPELAKIGAAIVLTAPFIPMLFQGEEWGASSPFQYFTNFDNTELGKAVSEGRRGEFAAFGWEPDEVPDPQSAETFQRSKLNWSELKEESHASLCDWHRQLIRLRRQIPALGTGPLDSVAVRYDESARWIVVDRGAAVVVCNLGADAQTIPSPKHGEISLASQEGVTLSEDGIHMPGESAAIVKIEE
ncbi:MAG: malto-oligosyltrehalose trehalohydrolase [Caldilineaceae bacterium]|nr:malto-oligosyltrehalose trehalohydrolase [Caldilineaceae bacterium]